MNRFYFKNLNSPTQFNLAKHLQNYSWAQTSWPWRAQFSDNNLEFDLVTAQHLEFKHLLAYLVNEFCPEVMPVAFPINDQNFFAVIQHLQQSEVDSNDSLSAIPAKQLWILKPALLNNGQGIKIFENLEAVRNHFLNPQRLGGDHVLQHYLDQPHLLNGHKYSIRMFVILTNYGGNYLYPHGYFNVAQSPYQPTKFCDLRSHLTNEHLSEAEGGNVIQIPSQRCDFFSPIYQQIQIIVEKIIKALKNQHPQAFIKTKKAIPQLSFFGFDFMVDQALRVWLLEINHGPCFPVDPNHVLQEYLYDDFWKAVIENFIVPIAEKNYLKKVSETQFSEIKA